MRRYASFLALGCMVALPTASAGAATLQTTLPAGAYRMVELSGGMQRIEMEGFGALTEPGMPQLPSRTFLIAIPPGATVHDVQISPAPGRLLPGDHRIIPAKADLVGSRDGLAYDPAVNRKHWKLWNERVEALRSLDDPTPSTPAEYLGDGTWRGYRYVRVRFVPFSYRPARGELTFYPYCTVRISYTDAGEAVRSGSRDAVMEDWLARWIVNFNEARGWYHDAEEPVATASYDYVIIAGNSLLAEAADTLARWKRRIGFNVKTVTLDSIFQQAAGRDEPEQIWNFLKEKYPQQQWGIRYVLLVGDVDLLPTRFLFPSELEWPYASDYYYAKLSGAWDLDGDDRWGEFDDDNLDPAPDVLVGRVPFSDPQLVQTLCQKIVAYERDTGSWKRNILHAAGICDYAGTGTDEAVLVEYLKANTLGPAGWTSRTLYEKLGIKTSQYSCDEPLLEANFLQNLGPSNFGMVNVLAHGSPGGMASQVWNRDIDGDGEIDTDTELGWNWYSQINNIPLQTHSVVFLCGCSTAPPCNTVNAAVGTSWTIVRTPLRNLARHYLIMGAPAVIGSTAGSDYKNAWDHPNDGNGQSLDYYFVDELVRNDLRVGDAFYASMLRYATNHQLQRGIRVFTLLGDPSLTLKGLDDRPGGADVVVYDGVHYDAACDNADGGDMYIGLLTTNPLSAPSGEVRIVRSTDHGQSWSLWQTLQLPHTIRDLDLVVAEFGTGEFTDNRLLLVMTLSNRSVMLYRFPLDGGAPEVLAVASEDPGRQPGAVAIIRSPEPRTYRLHLAYAVGEESTGAMSVRAARSLNNGVSWVDWDSWLDALFPDIEAGPNDHVYLTLCKANARDDIAVYRSTDGGENWGSPVVLTEGDGAIHHDLTEPVVAASTDPAVPTVWVAYAYQSADGDHDLRYAYSTNAGVDWTTGQNLSGNAGEEGWIDMRAYRASPNRWVNAAYIPDLTPFAQKTVLWRYSSGSNPGSWSSPRIVNDAADAAGMPPRVLYSPGAPATGSGVVYSDGQRVYFTAPWLPDGTRQFGDGPRGEVRFTATAGEGCIELRLSLPQQDRVTILLRDEVGRFSGLAADTVLPAGDHAMRVVLPAREAMSPHDRRLLCTVTTRAGSLTSAVTVRSPEAAPVAPSESSVFWLPQEGAPGVFLISSLARIGEGSSATRFAGAVVSVDATRNEGCVLRAQGDSEQWERTDTLLGCSSVTSLFVTAQQTLLAGGMRLYGNDAFGVLYRSDDRGESWELVHEFANGIVYDLAETPRGELLAATGWNGLVFRSSDDGQSWEQASEVAQDITITSILARGDQVFIGTEAQRGGGVYVSPDQPLLSWSQTQGWAGQLLAVHDLIELNGRLFAGVGGADATGVYRSDSTGMQWAALAVLPDTSIAAIRCLAPAPGRGILAGAEMVPGVSAALVCRSENEGEDWQVLGGNLELANSVYALLVEDHGKISAGTGYVYGRIFRYDPTVSGIGVDGEALPHTFSLAQNYPNPFNPETAISYGLAARSRVRLAVFDVLGREVAVLVAQEQSAGRYRVTWRPRLASGVYLYRLDARPVGERGERFVQQRKMLLLR